MKTSERLVTDERAAELDNIAFYDSRETGPAIDDLLYTRQRLIEALEFCVKEHGYKTASATSNAQAQLLNELRTKEQA